MHNQRVEKEFRNALESPSVVPTSLWAAILYIQPLTNKIMKLNVLVWIAFELDDDKVENPMLANGIFALAASQLHVNYHIINDVFLVI